MPHRCKNYRSTHPHTRVGYGRQANGAKRAGETRRCDHGLCAHRSMKEGGWCVRHAGCSLRLESQGQTDKRGTATCGRGCGVRRRANGMEQCDRYRWSVMPAPRCATAALVQWQAFKPQRTRSKRAASACAEQVARPLHSSANARWRRSALPPLRGRSRPRSSRYGAIGCEADFSEAGWTGGALELDAPAIRRRRAAAVRAPGGVSVRALSERSPALELYLARRDSAPTGPPYQLFPQAVGLLPEYELGVVRHDVPDPLP